MGAACWRWSGSICRRSLARGSHVPGRPCGRSSWASDCRAQCSLRPNEQMERVMGDHRAGSVARASRPRDGLVVVFPTRRTRWRSRCSRKALTSLTAMIFMFGLDQLGRGLGVVLVIPSSAGKFGAAAEFHRWDRS